MKRKEEIKSYWIRKHHDVVCTRSYWVSIIGCGPSISLWEHHVYKWFVQLAKCLIFIKLLLRKLSLFIATDLLFGNLTSSLKGSTTWQWTFNWADFSLDLLIWYQTSLSVSLIRLVHYTLGSINFSSYKFFCRAEISSLELISFFTAW